MTGPLEGRRVVITGALGGIGTATIAALQAAGALVHGIDLHGLVRADTAEQAGHAIVRACIRRPRSITTSRLSTFELWAARRFPGTAGAVLERRFRRRRASTTPAFLRFPSKR